MTENNDIEEMNLYSAAVKIKDHIDKRGTITLQTIKKWYPMNAKIVISYGLECGMFRRIGKKKLGPTQTTLDDTHIPEDMKKLEGTPEEIVNKWLEVDVDMDKIELEAEREMRDTNNLELEKEYIHAPILIKTVEQQTLLLASIVKSLKNLESLVSDFKCITQYQETLKTQMLNLEQKVNKFVNSEVIKVDKETKELPPPPEPEPEFQEDPFMTKMVQQLAGVMEVINYGYKPETRNYWVNLKSQFETEGIAKRVTQALHGLGFRKMQDGFYWLKKNKG